MIENRQFVFVLFCKGNVFVFVFVLVLYFCLVSCLDVLADHIMAL